MKKAWLILALALSLLLSACGGSSSTVSRDSVMNAESMSASPGDAPYENGYSSSDTAQVIQTGAQAFNTADVKLILRADLDVEALDFDLAANGLEALVDSLGGYLESKELYQGGYYATKVYRSASYVIRVPSGQYSAFLAAVPETANCHVVRTNEYMEDVGQEYFDIESRLKTQRIKQERLQALLAQATSMEDIIALENALTDVEYEIDQYTTSLNRYDGLIDYATMSLSLSQVGRLSDQATEPEGLGARMVRGFKNSVRSFVEGLGDLAVWFSYNCIGILIFLAIAIPLLCFGRRAWKKRRGPRPPAPPAASPGEGEK